MPYPPAHARYSVQSAGVTSTTTSGWPSPPTDTRSRSHHRPALFAQDRCERQGKAIRKPGTVAVHRAAQAARARSQDFVDRYPIDRGNTPPDQLPRSLGIAAVTYTPSANSYASNGSAGRRSRRQDDELVDELTELGLLDEDLEWGDLAEVFGGSI